MESRSRILMLAFACEPDEGSEPEVGWKWAHTMAESCDVTVVTQTKNRSRIERWYEDHPSDNLGVKFTYIELVSILRWLKKRLPGGMYLYYTLWQWKLRSHCARLLQSGEYDLMHHVTFASFRMPVFVSGKPVVWGPVGGAEMAPMHLLEGYGTFAGKLREKFRNFTTRVAAMMLPLLEPTRRNGGIALASTPATAELLTGCGILPKMMPTIGYDFDETATITSTGSKINPLRLLFVGRLHLLKGLHLILRALAGLQPGQAHLTIVGNGPEYERLLQLTKELGIDQQVTFAGFVERGKLPDIFLNHDVVVAPSLYESGGLSVLEGFSHGLPAIVLTCGGHALSVIEGCGIRVRPDQDQAAVVSQLMEATQRYSIDRDLVMQHGANARKHLKEYYAWRSKHDTMLRIYTDLIGNQIQENHAESSE